MGARIHLLACGSSALLGTQLLFDEADFSDFQIVGGHCLDNWPTPMIQSVIGIFCSFRRVSGATDVSTLLLWKNSMGHQSTNWIQNGK